MFYRFLLHFAVLLFSTSGTALAHIDNPHEAIADDLAEQLVSQLTQVNHSTISNLGVTRWVLAETLKQPEKGDSLYGLSHQLSESLYAHLKERNVNLLEFRAQEYVTLTDSGSTALSRNTEKLDEYTNLDWILVGTLSRKDAGTMVNLRVIDRRNQEVLAAANRYVPKHLYWSNKKTELVNGHLQRN